GADFPGPLRHRPPGGRLRHARLHHRGRVHPLPLGPPPMRTLRTAPALCLLLLTTAALAQGGGARTYGVQDGSALTYTLIHKLHEVKGTSKRLEGKARLLPDGTLQVAVRARVE